MLIAIAAFLILHFGFGSSSMLAPFDQVEKAIKHSVTDPAHKKQALAIVDQMKEAEKALIEKQKKSFDSLDKVLAKRTAPASEVERALVPIGVESKAARARLLELRFELRSVLSASEWAEVFPPPTPGKSPPKKSP